MGIDVDHASNRMVREATKQGLGRISSHWHVDMNSFRTILRKETTITHPSACVRRAQRKIVVTKVIQDCPNRTDGYMSRGGARRVGRGQTQSIHP